MSINSRPYVYLGPDLDLVGAIGGLTHRPGARTKTFTPIGRNLQIQVDDRQVRPLISDDRIANP